MNYRRYAVYWAPEAGSDLARFAAGWLGWDPEAGAETGGLDLDGLQASRDAVTASPRRYGFHGTLKPPFRLAEGRGFDALDGAVADLAGGFAGFDLPPLKLEALGPFLALVPDGPALELQALAEACMLELDGFRAPAGEEELARRRAVGLTPDQEALLAQWGYPYVLDEFRFHLTLTGSLALEVQAEVRAALEPAVAVFTGRPVPFREICVFGEGEDGMFRIVTRHRLRVPAAAG